MDINYKILEELRKTDGYVSGEELAGKFSISRQALWKHIGKLTDKGYQIVAVPHSGYKLVSAPDKFYPEEIKCSLRTKIIGRQVHYYNWLDSTQNKAWELGLQNAPEGTVVFTQTQKKGRGRVGRSWVSAKGGIYFSLLLRPKSFLIQEIPRITLLMALGCMQGIKKTTGIQCAVKWPNDIFLNNKKLGGILCEMHAEADNVHFVVAGIGININTKDLPPQGTSLFLHEKKKLSKVPIACGILEEIESYYLRARRQGFSELLKEWQKFSLLCGRRIKVKVMTKHIEGEASGIDENGYLLLREDNGFIQRISAGDVVKVQT